MLEFFFIERNDIYEMDHILTLTPVMKSSEAITCDHDLPSYLSFWGSRA